MRTPCDYFRAEWVLVPLCLVIMAYILHHVRAVLSWEQIMESLHLQDPERYTRLDTLGLVGILIVATVKIFGGK